MRRHSADPFVPNGGSCNAGAEVQRGFSKAAHPETPLDIIDRRCRRIKASRPVLGDSPAKARVFIEAA